VAPGVKIARGRIVIPKELVIELLDNAGEVDGKIIASIEAEFSPIQVVHPTFLSLRLLLL
jgi:hypothetical protein